jgi:pimeloyl-ACP methyl ester carboxylesterase
VIGARRRLRADDSRRPSPYGASDDPGWRELDAREFVCSAELQGGQVNYVDVGSAPSPPLVLLHGIGGCWQHWIQNIPRLAQEHRVIATDLPGFGASPLPARAVSVSLYTEIVVELLDQLGVGACIVIGNSLGGMVAIDLAARFSTRVERIVLVAPAGVSIASIRHGAEIAVRLAALQSRRASALIRPGGGSRHPMSLVVHDPEQLERGLLRAAFAGGSGGGGFQRVALHLMLLRLRGRLMAGADQVTCPTLIVWGRDDRINRVGDAAVFGGLIPTATAVIMDEAGHVPMLERPREFNRLVLEFAH